MATRRLAEKFEDGQIAFKAVFAVVEHEISGDAIFVHREADLIGGCHLALVIIRAGVRGKHLREEGSDLFATVLVSLVRGVLLERARQGQPLEPEADRTVDLFLHGAAR